MADGGVILAGNTYGDWYGKQGEDNGSDFAAMKLDSDGSVTWRWQVR